MVLAARESTWPGSSPEAEREVLQGCPGGGHLSTQAEHSQSGTGAPRLHGRDDGGLTHPFPRLWASPAESRRPAGRPQRRRLGLSSNPSVTLGRETGRAADHMTTHFLQTATLQCSRPSAFESSHSHASQTTNRPLWLIWTRMLQVLKQAKKKHSAISCLRGAEEGETG